MPMPVRAADRSRARAAPRRFPIHDPAQAAPARPRAVSPDPMAVRYRIRVRAAVRAAPAPAAAPLPALVAARSLTTARSRADEVPRLVQAMVPAAGGPALERRSC